MRDDMMKVLTERPRGGSWLGYDGGLRRSGRLRPEEAPLYEAMSMHRGEKSFSDHLGPLRRFLASSCGRPWDDVYSEICAGLGARGTLQRHLLQHLRWMVETDPLRAADHPCRCGKKQAARSASSRWRYFVCQRTGRLEAAEERPRRRPRETEPRPLPLGNGELALRVGGFWYAFRTARWPAAWTDRTATFDLYCRGLLGDAAICTRLQETFRDTLYCTTKRQLSRREASRLGVSH